jgi:hypothetical protein
LTDDGHHKNHKKVIGDALILLLVLDRLWFLAGRDCSLCFGIVLQLGGKSELIETGWINLVDPSLVQENEEHNV